jgi:hypothetical protein
MASESVIKFISRQIQNPVSSLLPVPQPNSSHHYPYCGSDLIPTQAPTSKHNPFVCTQLEGSLPEIKWIMLVPCLQSSQSPPILSKWSFKSPPPPGKYPSPLWRWPHPLPDSGSHTPVVFVQSSSFLPWDKGWCILWFCHGFISKSVSLQKPPSQTGLPCHLPKVPPPQTHPTMLH